MYVSAPRPHSTRWVPGRQSALQERPSQPALLQRIRANYLEMPGQALTLAQAQRLWNLDRDTCTELLEALVGERFLYQTRDGLFARCDPNGALSSQPDGPAPAYLVYNVARE